MRLLNDKCDPKMMSSQSLAFIGDAVYSLLVREKLCCEGLSKSGELHSLSAKNVKAQAQAHAYKLIEPMLTEYESGVYRRGRNAHNNNTPKTATGGEYHSATGVEALFGYLYLDGQTDRISELFKVIWDGKVE